jgi:hypothetical protein
MRTIIAMAAMLAASAANAAPVSLACAGRWVVIDLTGKTVVDLQEIVSITVDITNSTITYDDRVYQAMQVEDNWVRVDSTDEIGSKITTILNRVTGEVSDQAAIGRSSSTFNGVCKPTQKLF